MRQLAGPSRPRAVAAYLATAWLLGNWWLHDNLHVANGTNLNGLIVIEYGFHATLIVAGGIVGWQLLHSIDDRRTEPRPLHASSEADPRGRAPSRSG